MDKIKTRVLDLGCGHGFHTYCLSKKHDVTGVDICESNVNLARSRYPLVDFRVMDSEHLDFSEGTFDEIHAMDVLEHIDDLGAVIGEIRRVLKKGGRLIISVPAEDSEKWLMKLRPTYFEEIHHVRVFSNDELPVLLIANGFALLRKKATGFLTHLELYYLFTRKRRSNTQTSINSWRDNWVSKVIHASLLFSSPDAIRTPLRYIPLWIITVPLGTFIDLIGSRFFPKSIYYEFEYRY